ncbi:restriction endonuclease [Asticcacaulis sp. ZE23SCel15]|uniref:restriction endonuclease n=1 Tax=Asticcacaulis sp. ZE23SCel15 TaxID=3059027 RepID=UPI00265F2986|nr:restriction endonuclease [Asticcacaulis sp. ZE23SCel15]WKL56548.1 restriction endonuclease [Asticcacaulis sp. ZE23SCel15]
MSDKTAPEDYIQSSAASLGLSLADFRVIEVPLPEELQTRDIIRAVSLVYKDRPIEVRIPAHLSEINKKKALISELSKIRFGILNFSPLDRDFHSILEELKASEDLSKPNLLLSSFIVPEEKIFEGTLVAFASLSWNSVVSELAKDWSRAFEIPPYKWEEIIAGAYKRAGFDEVILTPRSGDHGRDVIATRKGIGSIKIIGSVKAYAPDRKVSYDDVRALLGVMSGELNVSKGIVSTTAEFPPKILDDPFIGPFVPYRLELMNGARLQEWLADLAKFS